MAFFPDHSCTEKIQEFVLGNFAINVENDIALGILWACHVSNSDEIFAELLHSEAVFIESLVSFPTSIQIASRKWPDNCIWRDHFGTGLIPNPDVIPKRRG